MIASGYTSQENDAALILGPTGLAYDPEDDVLFVASTADNTIFAVPQAGSRTGSSGRGAMIFSGRSPAWAARTSVWAKRKPADRQWRRGQRRSDPAERNRGVYQDGPLRSPVQRRCRRGRRIRDRYCECEQPRPFRLCQRQRRRPHRHRSVKDRAAGRDVTPRWREWDCHDAL